MLPHDLEETRLALPPGERGSLVCFTGSDLRHLRIGYLLQHRFPGLLQRWWAHRPRPASRSPAAGLGHRVRRSLGLLRGGGPRALLAEVLQRLARRRQAAAERLLFGAEVERLRRTAAVHPTFTPDPNADPVVAELEALQPYFLVTAGGGLLRRRVLSCVRGLAINQHAGWAPELKGSSTVEAALYHRQIGWVGSTVHLMDTFADAGAVLRRSTATLHPDDRIEHCFLAVVALGTELLSDVLEEALRAESIGIYPQPHRGATVLARDFGGGAWLAVRRDLARGWLAAALDGRRDW